MTHPLKVRKSHGSKDRRINRICEAIGWTAGICEVEAEMGPEYTAKRSTIRAVLYVFCERPYGQI